MSLEGQKVKKHGHTVVVRAVWVNLERRQSQLSTLTNQRLSVNEPVLCSTGQRHTDKEDMVCALKEPLDREERRETEDRTRTVRTRLRS